MVGMPAPLLAPALTAPGINVQDESPLSLLWREVGLPSWHAAFAVVVSTVAIYAFFVLLVRVLGQRVLSRASGFDVAAVIALGAITGRVTLGYTPTLVAGALALLTLFAAEAVVGELRRVRTMDSLFDNRAVVLVAGGKIQEDLLRRSHFVEDELRASLRRHGVHRLEDAELVVLERTGEISVLHTGRTIDPFVVHNVIGADRLPDDVLRHDDD